VADHQQLAYLDVDDGFRAGRNALINVLAEASGKEDREGRNITRLLLLGPHWVGVATGIAAAATFRFIPWRRVFQVSAATPTHELQLACALTLGFLVLNFPLSMGQSIYSAYQDGFSGKHLGIGANSLALLALVVVSRSHGGLPQLVLALSGTRAAVAIANYFSCSGATTGSSLLSLPCAGHPSSGCFR